jgi:FkbM family methyltransferase
MQKNISQTVLPNGTKIFCRKGEHPEFTYEEVSSYIKNGIELHEGDTIFDIGANIGLFTLWLYQLCNQNVTIYAFEPIPATFEVLYQNAQRLDSEKLKVFPYGLSKEAKTMMFSHHLNASFLSNAYPDEFKKEEPIYRETIARNIENAPLPFRLLRWFPLSIRLFLFNQLTKNVGQVEQVNCQVKTVSQIISEQKIQQINLLKVDAQSSELDVLLGIENQDWPKIQQVVVEVHNWDGRLEKISTLLKKHGLSKITVEQHPFFKGSHIFTLYSLRPKI